MDRRQFLAGSGMAALFLALEPRFAFAQTPGDAGLHAAIDRVFEGDLTLSPQTRTEIGFDKGEFAWARSRLNSVGEAAEAAQDRHAASRLAEIHLIDPKGLSEIGQVRRDVVIDMLEQRLVSKPFGIGHVGAPYRLSQMNGAYYSIPDFLDSTHPVETAEDAEAYLSRLSAFQYSLDDESAAQRGDTARGYLAPRWSLDLVEAQIGGLIEPGAAESGLVRSLVRRTSEKGIAGDWSGRATKIVEDEVFPALRRQLALVKRLKPGTRKGDGVWRLPRGDEIYDKALRYFTTTDQTPDQIHQTGLEQVAQISAELDTILKGAGLTQGSVGERLLELNKRPDQLFPNTDAGRTELIASINAGMAAMDKKLGQMFSTLPTQPLEVRRVPPEIQDGAPNGYYTIATLDGSRPAIYWINLKDTGDWPKYSLPSLTYHEGNPGHHLHLSLLQQDADLPVLLKNYWLSAYGEGWGLYAEQVAEELGGYTGLEKAGALQSWLFRAARLVVDTGLHAKRWTRERATQYMVDTVAFTPARSQREIERYCVMPGQACSYKIGQNVWQAQRKRAEQALGSKFVLGDFHDLLKEGVMPLAMFEQRVGVWIEKVKAKG